MVFRGSFICFSFSQWKQTLVSTNTVTDMVVSYCLPHTSELTRCIYCLLGSKEGATQRKNYSVHFLSNCWPCHPKIILSLWPILHKQRWFCHFPALDLQPLASNNSKHWPLFFFSCNLSFAFYEEKYHKIKGYPITRTLTSITENEATFPKKMTMEFKTAM